MLFCMIKVIKKIWHKIKKQALIYSYRGVLRRNTGLKNAKAGGRCFILGNGPSLNTQDLKRLANEETFVVNTFWNHPQYKEINPKYHIVIDWDVFPRSGQKNNFFSDELLQKCEFLSSCPTKFFFHAFGKEFIEKKCLLKNNSIYYLLNQGILDDNLRFNIEIDKTIPYTKNVIVAAIMIAIYMGFEEIYLLGCEHDFLAYPQQNHYERFPHFFKNPYDLEKKELTDYYAMAIMPYEKHVYSTLVLFKNYRLLKEKIAKEKPDVKIYNATPNSFLDVFPMVKFEDIVL